MLDTAELATVVTHYRTLPVLTVADRHSRRRRRSRPRAASRLWHVRARAVARNGRAPLRDALPLRARRRPDRGGRHGPRLASWRERTARQRGARGGRPRR